MRCRMPKSPIQDQFDRDKIEMYREIARLDPDAIWDPPCEPRHGLTIRNRLLWQTYDGLHAAKVFVAEEDGYP